MLARRPGWFAVERQCKRARVSLPTTRARPCAECVIGRWDVISYLQPRRCSVGLETGDRRGRWRWLHRRSWQTDGETTTRNAFEWGRP